MSVEKDLVDGLKRFAECKHESLKCEGCGARASITAWSMPETIRLYKVVEVAEELLEFVKQKYPGDFDEHGNYHFKCPLHKRLDEAIRDL